MDRDIEFNGFNQPVPIDELGPKEINHDGPQSESIVETHLGLPPEQKTLRFKLLNLILDYDVDYGTSALILDRLLDELHHEMMPRTGVGAVLIGRIKRGEL